MHDARYAAVISILDLGENVAVLGRMGLAVERPEGRGEGLFELCLLCFEGVPL